MSDNQSEQSNMQGQIPPPILLSAVLCDTVILDRITGKASVIGIFSVINSRKYPARHPKMSLFCEMTGGRGKMPVTAQLIDLHDDEKILVKQSVDVDFSDPLAVNGIIIDFIHIPFPHSGEYRFQIYAGHEYCGERRIICQVVRGEEGDRPDE
ncbi:MAG: hypothetical protein JXA82_02480 [Sedimentisphaerales bacterium]|nr:hypothetical protein [Sedimentisphaerales bacterium]